MLVINIILSPELTIHGIKLTITIVKIKPVKRFSVKPDCAGVYHAGDSHFLFSLILILRRYARYNR
nr:hypothetical protein [Salmonella enterica subsp. enterica]